MDTHPYLPDLSDAEWCGAAPPTVGGKDDGAAAPTSPAAHHGRTSVNAMVSILRAGCAWRWLPHEGLPWQTVAHSVRRWRRDGTWERGHRSRRAQFRVQVGREPAPSAGASASQSVTTTAVGGERGDDGATLLVGRTRYGLVDPEGVIGAPERAFDHQQGPSGRQAPAHRVRPCSAGAQAARC
jgi:transposase